MCIRGGGLALACVSAVAERRAATRGCIRGGGARNFGVVHPRGRSVYGVMGDTSRSDPHGLS